MLVGLCLALVPSLVLPPTGDAPIDRSASVSRRVLLRSAAASVLTVGAAARAEEGDFAKQGGMQDRPASLGSAGISAYQKLK